MAQKININIFGNQTLTTTLNSVPLLLDFAWNGRSNRYMLGLTNTNTGEFAKPQSVEPFSAMDISTLGLGEDLLIPVMSNPVYLDTGEISYQYEDLGTNLVLALFTPDELPLVSIYAPITSL
jgi:hypothetical protein